LAGIREHAACAAQRSGQPGSSEAEQGPGLPLGSFPAAILLAASPMQHLKDKYLISADQFLVPQPQLQMFFVLFCCCFSAEQLMGHEQQ
jgi:hypothetical protein